MQVLYLSVLASNRAIQEAQNHDSGFSSYAVQKFNRLVVNGLAKNGASVTALSTFFQPSKRFIWVRKNERENDVNFKYISSPNISFLRHLWISVYCFCYAIQWGFRNKNEKALLCDVLNASACIGAVTASRLIGLRCVGIMTDMPELMVSRSNKPKQSIRKTLFVKLNRVYMNYFTHYVFLTEQMNKVVNRNNHPYIIMEGLVDASLMGDPESKVKESARVVLYAGGLHERYGLKLLVDGFIEANVLNSELWLYGNGPFVDELMAYQDRDERIKYKGICPNQEVVNAEMKATLLVNPRPIHEEFTLYSFPSKNMEYMVSGTPLLTTKLPGMPEEYYPYVYLFEKASVDGYAKALRDVLNLSDEELKRKGEEAREWVLMHKNNISQAKRILHLIEQ